MKATIMTTAHFGNDQQSVGSSTMSVSTTNLKPGNGTITGKRRVRFTMAEPSARIIKSIGQTDHDEKNSVYCSKQDLMRYKSAATRTAHRVFDQDNRHDDKSTVNQCYSFVMWEAFDACRTAAIANHRDVPNKVKDSVQHWIQTCPSLRGLERLCVPALTGDRRETSDKAVHSVLRMQAKTIQGVQLKHHPELIAKVYQQLSKPSTIYARMMGQIDAVAAITTAESLGPTENDVSQKRSKRSSSRKKERTEEDVNEGEQKQKEDDGNDEKEKRRPKRKGRDRRRGPGAVSTSPTTESPSMKKTRSDLMFHSKRENRFRRNNSSVSPHRASRRSSSSRGMRESALAMLRQ